MEKKHTKLSFGQIKNWFGDRGFEVSPRCFKKFGNNYEYIYWMPSKKCQEEYLASGYNFDNTILWVPIANIYCELEDEATKDNVPFALEWTE